MICIKKIRPYGSINVFEYVPDCSIDSRWVVSIIEE